MNPPSPALWLGGAILWGLMMTSSAGLALFIRNGLQTDRLGTLLLVYLLGGLLAWPLALKAGHICGRGRHTETRFAAFFLFLSVGTMLATAFFFALDYRIFYSRWHAPFGSTIWMLQFVFTGASAVYQFGILGSRLFLPLGLVWLPLTSFYLARRL